MDFKYVSKNGALIPAADAVMPVSSIEFSYGFGVYETIRIAKGKGEFMNHHMERLMDSARIIGLEHVFTPESVEKNVYELVEANGAETCNLKILLIGAPKKEDAVLFIMCLNPLFPDKKLYRDGAHAITYVYERAFPQAKTLNMLQSYMAYREARKVGAYDALLVSNRGTITEGTRTNFFCVKGRSIVSPPEKDILSGVMRKSVLECARSIGLAVIEEDILLSDIASYDGAFITSTSTKIMPLRSIDVISFNIPDTLHELMDAFEEVDRVNG